MMEKHSYDAQPDLNHDKDNLKISYAVSDHQGYYKAVDKSPPEEENEDLSVMSELNFVTNEDVRILLSLVFIFKIFTLSLSKPSS